MHNHTHTHAMARVRVHKHTLSLSHTHTLTLTHTHFQTGPKYYSCSSRFGSEASKCQGVASHMQGAAPAILRTKYAKDPCEASAMADTALQMRPLTIRVARLLVSWRSDGCPMTGALSNIIWPFGPWCDLVPLSDGNAKKSP